ncbi:probable protein ABIL5 [Aristolochia californica]|uniref:probable protein ABIL5 n=1 Tax=Aristolochia californica TaxID=171875 RepID=UPI0035D9B2F7
MEDSIKPSSPEDSETGSIDVERFDTSLRELRDLRYQLHFAADYCEQTFSKSTERKTVIEDTKEYICRAMVTVVDHLGNVSANMECLLSGSAQVLQTEFRLHCLNQKLLTCRQYTEKLDVGSSALFPRYHRRYTAPCNLSPLENSTDALREVVVDSVAVSESQNGLNHLKDGKVLDVAQTIQIPLVKSLRSISGCDLSTALPACDGPSILSKPRTPSFGSWPQDARKHGLDYEQTRKVIEGTHQIVSKERTSKVAPRRNFKVFLRRSKRGTGGSQLV